MFGAGFCYEQHSRIKDMVSKSNSRYGCNSNEPCFTGEKNLRTLGGVHGIAKPHDPLPFLNKRDVMFHKDLAAALRL